MVYDTIDNTRNRSTQNGQVVARTDRACAQNPDNHTSSYPPLVLSLFPTKTRQKTPVVQYLWVSDPLQSVADAALEESVFEQVL